MLSAASAAMLPTTGMEELTASFSPLLTAAPATIPYVLTKPVYPIKTVSVIRRKKVRSAESDFPASVSISL